MEGMGRVDFGRTTSDPGALCTAVDGHAAELETRDVSKLFELCPNPIEVRECRPAHAGSVTPHISVDQVFN